MSNHFALAGGWRRRTTYLVRVVTNIICRFPTTKPIAVRCEHLRTARPKHYVGLAGIYKCMCMVAAFYKQSNRRVNNFAGYFLEITTSDVERLGCTLLGCCRGLHAVRRGCGCGHPSVRFAAPPLHVSSPLVGSSSPSQSQSHAVRLI